MSPTLAWYPARRKSAWYTPMRFWLIAGVQCIGAWLSHCLKTVTHLPTRHIREPGGFFISLLYFRFHTSVFVLQFPFQHFPLARLRGLLLSSCLLNTAIQQPGTSSSPSQLKHFSPGCHLDMQGLLQFLTNCLSTLASFPGSPH